MTEYIIGKATVRIHGSYDLENVKAATTQFLKKVEVQRKKKRIIHKEEKQHDLQQRR